MIPNRLAVAMVCGLIAQGVAYADGSAPAQDSNTEITDRVVHKLLEADGDVARRLRVSTVNGVVTLDGTVYTASQMIKVLGDAKRVSGVVKVKNRLRIQM